MQLNEIHTDHEQATTSLKVVLLVFAVVLVGALSYLVWAQNTAPDTADNSAAVVKKTTTTKETTTPTKTTTSDPTADWKSYTSANGKIVFKYPSTWKVVGKSTVELSLTSDLGDTFSLVYPDPGIGFEAWTLGDEKKITTQTTGLVLTRNYGPSTAESNLDNYLYLAFGERANKENDTVRLSGQVKSLPSSLLETLDRISATVSLSN